jgi:arylsulfatase A-like enzyme
MPHIILLSLLGLTLAAAPKPNVILIYTDDHGWPDLGVTGLYQDLKTPHLDALAAAGVRCTNGYSSAPQCVPSRGGLLTSRYQNRFGLESNPDSLDGFNREQTVAERLSEAGYVTGQIGKWHLGRTKDIPEHGFQHVYAKHANHSHMANFTIDGKSIPMQAVKDPGYHLDACSTAAVSFITRFAKKPFFLYLAYRAPHVPLDAPKKYLDRFPGQMPERRRQALAMISAMDDGVGRIVAQLRNSGIEERTLIFFIGDNGAPLKIHKLDAPGGGPGWDGSLNAPMNGEKGMLTEGGIRVPFLACWKGTFPPGQVYEHPVIALDATASALALAGLSSDDLDGVNLVPHLSGQVHTAPHEALYWRWLSQSAIRKGQWKLLRFDGREYLFDLQKDPGETNNLFAKRPEMAASLRADLTHWANTLTKPGLEAVKSEGMKKQGEIYFSWYLDGKREVESPSIRPGAKASDAKKGVPPAELFERRDKNRDQRVTWDEYLAGRTGEQVSKLRQAFTKRDHNGDGVWTKDEIK